MANKQSEHLLSPEDGEVSMVAKPDITEKEIFDDRQLIIQRLDAAYLNLTDTMAPFQRKWDANPMNALSEAVLDGAAAGVKGWGNDFTEMFEKKTWVELGQKVENAAGSVYDTTKQYAIGLQKDIDASISKASSTIKNADQTLSNWSWWQAQIDDAATTVQGNYKSAKQKVDHAVATANNTADKARKIYTYRNEILNLPILIAEGDPKLIQKFVDTVLMDIDKELATDIKNDPNFYVVLEIIADHESVLSYLSYVSLTLEAIPPNFYAYLAAQGGAYLMIEVVMLIVTALISAGTAAAARITALAARIATSSSKVAGVVKKIEHAQQAFSAFQRCLEDFSSATNQLHRLGEKLTKARSRGVRLKGSTRTTLNAKRETIKRDHKCRICGSTKHSTPRSLQGTVVYE